MFDFQFFGIYLEAEDSEDAKEKAFELLKKLSCEYGYKSRQLYT